MANSLLPWVGDGRDATGEGGLRLGDAGILILSRNSGNEAKPLSRVREGFDREGDGDDGDSNVIEESVSIFLGDLGIRPYLDIPVGVSRGSSAGSSARNF